MTTKENLSHRQKLVDDGLLQDGKILQVWVDEEYATSYYVVLFIEKDQDDGYRGVSIRCFRVYGSDDEDHNMGPVRVSCDQDIDIGSHNGGIPTFAMRNNPNWIPAEGYER